MNRLVYVVVVSTAAACLAQSSCSSSIQPTAYAEPSVADGYTAQLLATGLDRPRSIVVDDRKQLLVSGSQISGLVLDELGCSVQRKKVVVEGDADTVFNHGLALSPDGKTLYASTSGSAYSWSYDSSTLTASNRRELVSGMQSGGHVTRTLLIPTKHSDLLLISRGSNGNLDMATTEISSGRSMIKVFNLTSIPGGDPVDYTRDGVVLGWGLRNSVGLAANPSDGGIWSVENSADQIQRGGYDIHKDDPGEELNYHGNLSDVGERGPNYGYPYCFAVYDESIPGATNLRVGDQFALNPNSTFTDATCNSEFRAPRLTFPAHTAPLSIVFNGSSTAFVTFHGSWNRQPPIGYELAIVEFGNDGQPRANADTKDPQKKVLWNEDLSICPKQCFRPTGAAVGLRGEVYVSGDSTGDIWIVRRSGANGEDKKSGAPKFRSVGLAATVMMMWWNVVL